MKPPPYTLTNESLVVIWEGKSHTVQKGSPHFGPLRKAIMEEDWENVPKNLTTSKTLHEWAKGKFTVKDDTFFYNQDPLPNDLNDRIIKMATGGEDPTSLFNFWERLQRNPSWRSVQQLWPFLMHRGIPLTPEGCFLAYKGVKQDLKDSHSGKFDNSPGAINEMPRNQISDDPKVECHVGFHVGALEYAKGFSHRVVVCKVDPEHVVCVPYDHSAQKMRVCRYEVIGHHNGTYLPSTTFTEDKYEDEPVTEEEEYAEHEEDKKAAGNLVEPHDYNDDPCEDECDECGNGIPDDAPDEYNHWHKDTCSSFRLKPETEDDEEVGSLTRQADALGYDPDEEDGGIAKAEAEEKKIIALDKKRKPKEEKRKPKRGFAKLDKLDMEGLLDRSIDELRKYATKALLIVGASKIPGGKVALIQKILEVRA